MRWYLKVAAFHALSALPGGPQLYRFSQNHFTKTLVPTRGRIGQKLDVGWQYWDWLKARDLTGVLLSGTHLDFGSGWHPTIPLLYYSLGVNRQYLFDVTPLLDTDLLRETIRVFREMATDPDRPHRGELARLPDPLAPGDNQWRSALAALGMEYVAPYHGRTQSLAGQIDIATSTQVLLYIGRENLLGSFRMLHGALKPGGLFLATVHLRDLYADADPHITPSYNHLKFSPWWWDHMVNTNLMSVNRLKARDYRQLLEQAGFILEAFDVAGPTEVELERLDKVKIHKSFAAYSREELAATHLFFVARKP
jgi:SAM-dependent methyltransferase